MLDLVEPFEFNGEKLGLLFSFSALAALEKNHGLPVLDAWDKITRLSVVAEQAAMLEGLEAHRREVEQRAVKWTLRDAETIVMGLGPRACSKLLTDAMARTLLKPEGAAGDAGKAVDPVSVESTGTPPK